MKTIKTTMKEPVIMFITDIHGDTFANKLFVHKAKELQPDLIILGGDISNNTKKSVREIFKPWNSSGIPIAYYPGSHENSDVLEPTLKEIQTKTFTNCIQPTNRLLRLGKFELIILPGSNAVASGTKPYYGGNYWTFIEPNKQQLKRNNERIREIKWAKAVRPLYISDTQKQIDINCKTTGAYRIGFCHDPPQFKKKTSIDVAHFGIATADFIVKKKDFKRKEFKEFGINREFFIDEGSVLALAEAKVFANAGYPVKILKRNVGNSYVNKFFTSNKIRKVFCGHIHEAGPRAINAKEEKIKPKTPSTNLYANNGTGFSGKYTLITLHTSGKISHQFGVVGKATTKKKA